MKKTDILKYRKNINDKFFDLYNEFIVTKTIEVKYKDKAGRRRKKKKTITRGYSKLARELEITVPTLKNYFNQGINKKNDVLFINVERVHRKLKLPNTERRTKQFSIHTLTKNNWFKKKKVIALKKNKQGLFTEKYYFHCGIYIEFANNQKNGSYIIHNVPQSYDAYDYNTGWNDFRDRVFEFLEGYKSIKFFRFNYFNVTIVSIE